VVLIVSSALNAAYFLPPVASAWVRPAMDDPSTEPAETIVADAGEVGERERLGEPGRWLLAPPIATAASVLVLGLLAGAPVSPLTWAAFIAEELRQP
jgi:multicomponent Na+:H+ antiporter subunit D